VTDQGVAEQGRGQRATRVGVVTSDKMDKSVVVRVDRTVKHKLYERYIKRSARFMAHDESNACKIGDTVEIHVTLKERLSNAFFLTGKMLLDGKLTARLDFACSIADPQQAAGGSS